MVFKKIKRRGTITRISKQKDERQEEIINIADDLFHTKGYDNTSVTDILDIANIAKGTFYHHFNSKEEVLDAVVQRGVNQAIEEFNQFVDDDELSPLKKLSTMIDYKFQALCKEDHSEIQAHKSSNALLHQKSLTHFLTAMTPQITRIIEEGINQGEFKVHYPQEITEIFFASVNFLFDPGLFEWSSKALKNKITAFEYLLEKTLSLPKESFNFTKPEERS